MMLFKNHIIYNPRYDHHLVDGLLLSVTEKDTTRKIDDQV